MSSFIWLRKAKHSHLLSRGWVLGGLLSRRWVLGDLLMVIQQLMDASVKQYGLSAASSG